MPRTMGCGKGSKAKQRKAKERNNGRCYCETMGRFFYLMAGYYSALKGMSITQSFRGWAHSYVGVKASALNEIGFEGVGEEVSCFGVWYIRSPMLNSYLVLFEPLLTPLPPLLL